MREFKNIYFSMFSVVNVFSIVTTDLDNQDSAFISGTSFFSKTTSVESIIASAIQAFLGLLGIIFIILLIIAGYKYMTAQGNETDTEEALKSIRRAIIGLLIIVSAYAITYFVFNSIDWFSGSGGSDIDAGGGVSSGVIE